MPTQMLTKGEHRPPTPPPRDGATEKDELLSAARSRVLRVRRVKINVAAWVLGTIAVTALWVLYQWQANGAFEHFGSHEGNPGDWNPTLWALIVGLWALVVGIMALRVYFERPTTEREVDREVERLKPRLRAQGESTEGEVRRFTRARMENIRRLKFHVAAWMLGMILLTPIWALIEWQDNGGFERFGNDSQPGEWEPWILPVGGIWALVVAVFALQVYMSRPAKEEDVDRELRRLKSR